MSELLIGTVYSLCLVTSSACAWLLGRSYRRSGTRFLWWSSLCFVLLAGNNLLLILDLMIIPSIDLQLGRLLMSLAAVSVLLFGFIWDLEDDL